ncbi:MAG: glycosyltransferase, partial [Acinetobacter sp.]|nr:glycosyltransferase [Acinetobacter sp.]
YQQIFSKHNKVISLCEEMTKVVSQDLRLPADKFTVIYNPLNLKEIEERSQSIKDLSQEKFLLCVTRLVGGKGLIELLEIYAKLKQQGITQKLCLIGDGELKDDLQQKIAELNLTQDVLLLGEMNNPYPYFKAADLFLFCSESEGLPTVLLESMACGTPIVAMDCLTGPKDILGANSEYGKLIPLHDKEKFVNAVLELLENPEIYQYYVEKSHQRIQDFSVEKIRVEVEKLFQEMDLKVR